MSKKRAGEELETAFRQILNEFLYSMPRGEASEILRTETTIDTPQGRHNYQRNIANANPTMHISYKGMVLATVKRKPHTIFLHRRAVETAPKGYFATKVLENMLYYEFSSVRVK